MSTSSSFYIQPFNDLQDAFYGIIVNRPTSTDYYTGSIDTADFDNFRDGVYLRTVNDYFKSDQIKVTFLPTSLPFVNAPNGVVEHAFPESEIIGISSLHSFTVNGDSVAFRDQIQGVDQLEYSSSTHLPGMVRYLQQSTLVSNETINESAVYPFFVDTQNRPEFNGWIIEPFPSYTGLVRYVQNPLAAQTGIRGNCFLGLDDAENANPMGSLQASSGRERNLGSLAEYQYVAPRPFLDSGADMIIVEADGMFVGKTSQRDNDVLSPVSCSHLTPWSDEYSGKSFIDILGGDRRNSLESLLSVAVPAANNPSLSLPYYAGSGYAFGNSQENTQQTRDDLCLPCGWHQDTSYNQASLYGADSVAFAGYAR